MAAREVVHRCPVCGEPLKPILGEKQYECGCCVMRYPAEVVNARHEHKVVLAEYAARCMAETDWDVSALTDDWGEDTYRVHVFSCPSCKVSLLSEYGNHVTTCPCCGASGLKPDPFFRVLRPNWIAPFLIDRETAVEKVRSFYELRPFLPGAFTRRKHTRAICRLYVPMWLMDFGAEAGALYQAKKRIYERALDPLTVYEEFFQVCRAGCVRFERLPFSGCSSIPDKYIRVIEPFDVRELLPFSPELLSGGIAIGCELSGDEKWKHMDDRCRTMALELLEDSICGYTKYTRQEHFVELYRAKVRLALVPIWLLCTRWRGRSHFFIMNGQSGRFFGDMPTSIWQVGLKFLEMLAALTAIITAVSYLIR